MLFGRGRCGEVADFGIDARNPLDRISDVGARRNDDPDVPSGQRSDVVDGEHVARIAHRNDQGLFLERDRQRRIALRQRMRHERRRRQVDLEIGQIHERKTDLRRERFDESGLADQAHIDQRASEALAGLLAFATGFVQLRLRDESVVDQDLAERARPLDGRRRFGDPRRSLRISRAPHRPDVSHRCPRRSAS